MLWQTLLQPDIQDFILNNKNADVAKLALKKWPHKDWPKTLILDQIKARQKAKHKLAKWVENSAIIFPSSDVVEQASSEATALYKASIINGENCVDLTAGAGIDTLAFTKHFKNVIAVEMNADQAEILENNAQILGISNLIVTNAKAEDFIQDMPSTDCVYIDPARRGNGQKGKFRFEDCSPDILSILPVLLTKSKIIFIKASPMLDITAGIKALPHVKDVYAVAWDNQCKELLFVLDSKYKGTAHIHAVELNDSGHAKSKLSGPTDIDKNDIQYEEPQTYLYDPNPAIHKTGLFEALCTEYNLSKIAPNSQLFTSKQHNPNFPGRCFKILDIKSLNTKDFQGQYANIICKNSPLAPKDLQKKLKTIDGGESYLIATTLKSQKSILIHCVKTIK